MKQIYGDEYKYDPQYFPIFFLKIINGFILKELLMNSQVSGSMKTLKTVCSCPLLLKFFFGIKLVAESGTIMEVHVLYLCCDIEVDYIFTGGLKLFK